MGEKLILVCVDDDEDALFIARLSLELDPDIVVLEAHDAISALGIIENHDREIDCVLTDTWMGDMSGIDLVKALRDRPSTASLPFIFLTASARLEDARAHTALGALGTITKPYAPLTLAAQVRIFLSENDMNNINR